MDVVDSFSLLTALKSLNELMDTTDKEECIQQRKYYAKPLFEKRQAHFLEAHILKDILWETSDYKNFCRINLNDFENLLSMVDSKIKKEDTVMRDAIPSRTRLAITLRYISTGDTYRSLEFLTHVSRKTISQFIPEVLNALISSLSDKYLKMPCNQAEWRNIADGFSKLWEFPHTLGAIDGKHIKMKRSSHAASDFDNHKGNHSIVLSAIVDAHSRFIHIELGRDPYVILLKNSSFYEEMMSGNLNLPPDEALPGQFRKTSYCFIGDDVFGIDQHMLTAYNHNTNLTAPQEIFNYRLSRARMAVEIAFGRLTSRFRIFHRPIELKMETCGLAVTSCCILHNMLSQNFSESSKPNLDPFVPELPLTIASMPAQQQATVSVTNEMRENIQNYLISDGDVSFQWSYLDDTNINI